MTDRQALAELVKIELECDASRIAMTVLGRNPLPTARFLEAVKREYPVYVRPDLSSAALRAKVMEDVVSPAVALCAADLRSLHEAQSIT